MAVLPPVFISYVVPGGGGEVYLFDVLGLCMAGLLVDVACFLVVFGDGLACLLVVSSVGIACLLGSLSLV